MARKIVPIKFIVLNVHQKLSQMEMNICRLDTIHECNTHRHRHRHTHTHTTVWHTRVHMAQFELEHNHKIFRPYCSETYLWIYPANRRATTEHSFAMCQKMGIVLHCIVYKCKRSLSNNTNQVKWVCKQ